MTMLRSAFFISVTGFWITMMSLLIQREYFQLSPVQTPYEIFALHNQSLREEYHAIYTGKERIGFNFSVLEALKESEPDAYELRHQTYLSFLFLGKEREMLVKGKARLNEKLELKTFEFKVSSNEYWTSLKGTAVKNNLNLVIEGKEGQPIRKIIPIDGPLLLSESLGFIWTPENLKLGKNGRVRLWNPLAMSLEDVTFRVARKEDIEYQGKTVNVFVALITQGGIDSRLWISPQGIVLREESPSGFRIQKEESYEIFEAMRKNRSKLPDLPNLYSIPSNQILEHPERLSLLKVKIKTPSEEKTLDLRRDDLKSTGSFTRPADLQKFSDLAPYLEETPFIQTKDPNILKTAEGITADENTAIGAALKIMTWVNQNIIPSPTVSIPSARDVLAIKKGDCNEFSALFTALARAAGIPAKMVAGIVYQNGRFYYHAWVEIFAGRWIGIDPTFGQAPVDVTHIPLVYGDLKEQAELVNKLGQMNVIILETK